VALILETGGHPTGAAKDIDDDREKLGLIIRTPYFNM
jgi:hypothetical protein